MGMPTSIYGVKPWKNEIFRIGDDPHGDDPHGVKDYRVSFLKREL